MIDLANEIWQTMSNNKLRTALTGIAVAWGIFMLIVLLGMSNGVVNAFRYNMGNQGANFIIVFPGTTTQAHQGYKMGRKITLREGDIAALEQRDGLHVAQASGKVLGSSQSLSTPRDYTQTYYEGVYPNELQTRGFKLTKGRFINDKDLADSRKVMVLSKNTAELIFATAGQAVGADVKFGDLMFRVVGIYDSPWARNVYVPYTTAKLLAGNSDVVNNITLTLQNVSTPQDGDDVEQTTRATLAKRHDFSTVDPGAVDIFNKFKQRLQMDEGMNIMNIAVWAIGILTLLSGIIGVSNIMFVSVKERTHEIGIRRAIGAKPRSILTQIISESVAITTLFGYIGIVGGTALTALIAKIMGESMAVRDPAVDLSICLQVTVVLILAGAMAGIFPALKALKVKPVEALRDE